MKASNPIRVVSNCYQWLTTPASDIALYDTHIPTSPLQKGILAVGSGIGSFFRPARDDWINVFGESTGLMALKRMRTYMQNDAEGQRILLAKPLITSETLDWSRLQACPRDSLGQAYLAFLKTNHFDPDARKPVVLIDDADLAYVMTRYRQTHDLLHTLLNMKTNLVGEIAVKWVEGIQFGLPLGILGGLVEPLRLKPNHRRLYLQQYLPWAVRVGQEAKFLLNVYYEQRWEQDIDELRRELRIPNLPLAATTTTQPVT